MLRLFVDTPYRFEAVQLKDHACDRFVPAFQGGHIPEQLPWQLLAAHHHLERAIDRLSYEDLYDVLGGPPKRPVAELHHVSSFRCGVVAEKALAHGIGALGCRNCPVCLHDFSLGDQYRTLPCDHSFHSQCVDTWLLEYSGDCPVCRTTAVE